MRGTRIWKSYRKSLPKKWVKWTVMKYAQRNCWKNIANIYWYKVIPMINYQFLISIIIISISIIIARLICVKFFICAGSRAKWNKESWSKFKRGKKWRRDWNKNSKKVRVVSPFPFMWSIELFQTTYLWNCWIHPNDPYWDWCFSPLCLFLTEKES